MLKKAIISGVVFCSTLLVGCNGEKEVAPELELTDSEQEAVVDDKPNFLPVLQNEIIVSITEQTELDSESIETIMVGGSPDNGMIDVSINIQKGANVNEMIIQQIMKDSIMKVSDTHNLAMSQENITINIEKY